MEFQDLIEVRRSIRSFDTEKAVTKEQICEVVQAAIQAPSWKNTQTSRYYCVLGEEVQKAFAEKTLPGFNQNSSNGAAYVVTTFVKNQVGFNADGTPANECGNGWGYYDLGLHNAYFILKAKELGLDTLIMGLRDAQEIREICQIPQEEEIVAVIALGYAKTEAAGKPKRKVVEDILKFTE